MGAGHGWICVGGNDKGRCAFLQIAESVPAGVAHGAGGRHTEVDALLPLDLDPESRMLAHEFLHRHAISPTGTVRRRPKVHIHELGGLIVNSITVHKLCSGKEGLQDEIVALLTQGHPLSQIMIVWLIFDPRNNDQTVRIYSLTQSRSLGTLHFPTPMNHATISPDGELLIAVGDEPRAFFCRRKRLASLAVEGESLFARYEWHEIAEPKLSLAIPRDACFSTAFSPSGHICAVASQIGTITIFDTSLIRDDMEVDEAVIDVLKSSRLCVNADHRGAIRSMSFAPEPWDLFAWAEDQGRVCVTDLRSAFQSRQIIELDTDIVTAARVHLSDMDEDFTTAEQRELEIEARFVQRHREALDAQDHLAAVNHAADYMELAAERRRLQREARESGHPGRREREDSPYALTDRERQTLDSIRVLRQRDNDREQDRREAGQQPFSVHYSRPSSTISPTRPTDQELSISNLSSTPQTTRSTSIHQYMRERNLERNFDRTRPSDRSYQPRRRSSVVISNSSHSNVASSSHPSSLAPIGTNTSNLSASPSRLASTSNSSSTMALTNSALPVLPSADPWQTISEAIATTGALDAANRLRRERDATLARQYELRLQQQQQTERMERLRAQRLRQLQERAGEGTYDDYELEMLRRLGERGRGRGFGRVEDGVGTMGVDWSRDGRYL